jgi:CheY-like chemotaxis protein
MLGTVLVVDDDADNREAVCVFLQGAGYPTAFAANGKQAIDWLAVEGHPKLILLDLTMPVMDGYQFLTVKEADPALSEVPVLIMSAVPNCRTLLLGHHLFRYLQKPIFPGELLDAVQHCMAELP